jgi:hypothetical protein
MKEALSLLPFRRKYPNRIHANKHLACLWLWTGDQLKPELFWPTVVMNPYCLNHAFRQNSILISCFDEANRFLPFALVQE